MSDLISVIVPIYNVEQYLGRCINSILKQTYTNIEIILVDDGSPDGSPEICDKFADEDSRIVVIHQQNQGLSAARNAGLKIANGEYVCFVDSDDYIDENMISILYTNMARYSAEISCCGHMDVYESGRIVKPRVNITEVFCTEEALRIFLYTKKIDVIAWNKMYQRTLFDGIGFADGKLFEDHFTIYKILERAKKIVNTTTPLYYYCKRSTSIGGTAFSDKNYQLKEALELETDYIKSHYPKLEHDIDICYALWMMVLYNKILLANKQDIVLLGEIRKIVWKEKKNIITSGELSKIKKIQLFLILGNRRIYADLYKRYLKKER